jgi:hypothetical protein
MTAARERRVSPTYSYLCFVPSPSCHVPQSLSLQVTDSSYTNAYADPGQRRPQMACNPEEISESSRAGGYGKGCLREDWALLGNLLIALAVAAGKLGAVAAGVYMHRVGGVGGVGGGDGRRCHFWMWHS